MLYITITLLVIVMVAYATTRHTNKATMVALDLCTAPEAVLTTTMPAMIATVEVDTMKEWNSAMILRDMGFTWEEDPSLWNRLIGVLYQVDQVEITFDRAAYGQFFVKDAEWFRDMMVSGLFSGGWTLEYIEAQVAEALAEQERYWYAKSHVATTGGYGLQAVLHGRCRTFGWSFPNGGYAVVCENGDSWQAIAPSRQSLQDVLYTC